MEKFSQRLALFTSYVFHPLFMPTVGLILVYYIGGVRGFNSYSVEFDQNNARFLLVSIFIATAILPTIVAVLLKYAGIVSSLHMPKKEERSVPFLLTFCCYFGVYLYLQKYVELPVPLIIYFFIFAGILATLLGFFVTLSWKISVHMIGIGGVVGMLTLLAKIGNDIDIKPLSIAILVAGLVAFGRLQLKAHSIKQIIAGFLLGFSCEMLGLIIAG